jgi:hypothetical protein
MNELPHMLQVFAFRAAERLAWLKIAQSYMLARVVIGAAVFAVGLLVGAGIAAWLVPPA